MNDYDLDILRLAGQGFCCSQIVLQLALELQDVENPGLLGAMASLCHGFPETTGPCGALTGAACLLGYYAGKARPEEDDERLPLMLAELSQWFRDRCSDLQEDFGDQVVRGISCQDLVPNGQPDTEICGGLIAASYGQAMTLLVENGFDPGSPRV